MIPADFAPLTADTYKIYCNLNVLCPNPDKPKKLPQRPKDTKQNYLL